ncbi:hypothetical protein SDC9_61421 [bioreactor metagenome]|uniref:Uncharacterized protein n=1 Tax=bioreactor metagenome TaxID=1076179 RepID=A0A644XFR1_9ZZZZ
MDGLQNLIYLLNLPGMLENNTQQDTNFDEGGGNERHRFCHNKARTRGNFSDRHGTLPCHIILCTLRLREDHNGDSAA